MEQRQNLIVKDSGSRVDVTFDRERVRNCLDWETWDDIATLMRGVQKRTDVRVVTLTGAGSSFCAGVSFEFIERSLQEERGNFPEFVRRWADIADTFDRCAPTTVAAINGPAVGAGLEIALACDLRIASERARFALPQMAMGMLPDCGGLSRLARATSESFAMDMVLTQRVVTAEEALAVGLVSRVVPHEQLSVELDAVASRIEAIPWPGALLATMVIEAGVQMDSRRAADLEAMADQVMLSKEAVWAKASEFINNKGLKGLRPG